MAKKTPHELAGQKIATATCPECSKDVPVKVNVNGIAYFFCRWPDAKTGDICNHQTRYSRRHSDKLIAAHLTPKPQEPEHAEDPEREAPAKRRSERGGGDFLF